MFDWSMILVLLGFVAGLQCVGAVDGSVACFGRALFLIFLVLFLKLLGLCCTPCNTTNHKPTNTPLLS